MRFVFPLLFRGARNQVQDQGQSLRFFSWLFVLLVSLGGDRVQTLHRGKKHCLFQNQQRNVGTNQILFSAY